MSPLRRLGIRFGFAALLLAGASLAYTPPAASHGHRHDHPGHGAHVHGRVELNLVLEENLLEIEMVSPAANMVGFEHAPRTAEQRQALAGALALLEEGTRLFHFPAAAGCGQQRVAVDSGIGRVPADDHGHADLMAHWFFRCDHPDRLDWLEVRIFEIFPAVERIRVQALTPRGQTGADLTAAAPRLSL